ncbi:MAG: hypothetical protein CVV51_10615, partial [Spirochaetae bacterium HGW-Spirochaetae-7]
DKLPDVAVPRVVVVADILGLPAREVRSLVALPLEDALASTKGLLRSSSVSRDDGVVIALDFRWGEDPVRAMGRVREVIDAAWQSLPEGAGKPRVLPYDPAARPLVVVTVAPIDGDMAFARRLADYDVRSRLRRVEGAGAIVVLGGCGSEVAVSVDMMKAAVRGMTVVDVARAIAVGNNDVPAGALREADRELVAVARGRASDAGELSALVATGPSGPFRISDLATVEVRPAPRRSLFVVGGEERVALELYRRPGADPIATARAVRIAVLDLAREFGRDAEISLVTDSSIPIAASIGNLAMAGAAGAAIAALALFMLLRDLAAGILVASSIPVSVAATLTVLAALGRSVNCMSLGGISLAIGMVSDNAVVVLDALSSRFSSSMERPSANEVSEVVSTALSGTFGSMVTTAVVFVPVFLLPGAIGGLFGDLAISIIASNASGWLTSVLALPAMYRMTWSPGPASTGRSLELAYRRMLAFSMRRPCLIVAVSTLAVGTGVALVATRPVSFMPVDAATELTVTARFPAGSDPDGMLEATRSACAAIEAIPGISGAYASAGSEDADSVRRADPGYSNELLTIICPLRQGTVSGSVRQAVLSVAGGILPAETVLDAREPPDPAAVLLGLDGGSVVAARGETVEAAAAKASEVESALGSTTGSDLASIAKLPFGRKPGILMTPEREASASLGVRLSDAAGIIKAATEGIDAATIESGGRELAVSVFAMGAGSADGGGSMAMLAGVPVSAGPGAPVVAASIARFERGDDEAAFARLDRADVVYIVAEPIQGRERQLAAAIQQALAITDAERSDTSAFRLYGKAMAGAVVLVLALLYLTLGAQFESFVMPLVIMATIPLAMAGVGPALAIAGIGLDSGSVLGLVVLFGTVVNNAILLYEASAAKAVALARSAVAAYAGAADRVRPVLATTITTVVALLPICLSPTGAAQRSMSIALLGGLVASTMLTLFVSPIAFASVGRRP